MGKGRKNKNSKGKGKGKGKRAPVPPGVNADAGAAGPSQPLQAKTSPPTRVNRMNARDDDLPKKPESVTRSQQDLCKKCTSSKGLEQRRCASMVNLSEVKKTNAAKENVDPPNSPADSLESLDEFFPLNDWGEDRPEIPNEGLDDEDQLDRIINKLREFQWNMMPFDMSMMYACIFGAVLIILISLIFTLV